MPKSDPLAGFAPHAIDRALCFLRGEWSSIERTTALPVTSMLSEPWRPDRLERCRGLLAEGQKPPPISVVGLRIGKRVLYSISDGNHRVEAAKEAGKRSISSKIGGYYMIDPKAFFLDAQNRLWKPKDDRRAELIGEVPGELVGILEAIGVRRVV